MARSTKRKEAKERGDITYTCDTECKHCGSLERYVSTYSCYECNKKSGLEKLANTELMASYRTNEKKWKFVKAWRADNPERMVQYNETAKPKRKNYYQSNKEHFRGKSLQFHYGIDLEEYDRMLKAQNGVCAICSKTCKSGKSLAVDHCHETGKVRGLLCGKCNTGIGLLENEERMIKAIEYLKENS